MFESSGNYFLVKRFRRENDENSIAFERIPLDASSRHIVIKRKTGTSATKFLRISVKKVDRLSKKRRIQRKENISPDVKPPRDTKRRISYYLMKLLYYLLLYLGIAILFYICFMFYMLSLPEEAPRVSKYQMDLIYYPNLESYYMNRISWRAQSIKDVNRIVTNIKEMLQKFGVRREYGECTESDSYGYKSRSPCIFLKVNRIAGFNVDAIEHSKDLPRREYGLKKLIDNITLHERKGRLWISCKTEAWVTIEYFPHSRSVPVERLNYKGKKYVNQKSANYSDDRIVAIKVRDIPIDIPFNIRCNMFAKNIEIDKFHRSNVGGVSFDVETKSG